MDATDESMMMMRREELLESVLPVFIVVICSVDGSVF
jgi:hypothetical protein